MISFTLTQPLWAKGGGGRVRVGGKGRTIDSISWGGKGGTEWDSGLP